MEIDAMIVSSYRERRRGAQFAHVVKLQLSPSRCRYRVDPHRWSLLSSLKSTG